MMMFKILASTIMGTLGGYYMYRGKKIQNMKMILVGAVLIVLSYFMFSGGGNDKGSQEALTTIMNQTGVQQTTLPTPGQQVP